MLHDTVQNFITTVVRQDYIGKTNAYECYAHD